MGKPGISFLIEFATTSGFGTLQELVLNTLAHQPKVQGIYLYYNMFILVNL